MSTTTRPVPRWICPMPCAGFGLRCSGSKSGRLDTAGWGLLLLWIGAAFLLGVGREVGLLGIGILTLVMQVIRRGLGLEYESFWLFVGGTVTLAAVWELAVIDVPFGPVLLIALGMAVLVWALRR